MKKGRTALSLSLPSKFRVRKWSSSAFALGSSHLVLELARMPREAGCADVTSHSLLEASCVIHKDSDFFPKGCRSYKAGSLDISEGELTHLSSKAKLRKHICFPDPETTWSLSLEDDSMANTSFCSTENWISIIELYWIFRDVQCAVSVTFGIPFCDWLLHSATSSLCDLDIMLTLLKQGFWGPIYKGNNAIYGRIMLLLWDRSSWMEVGTFSR